MYWHGFAFSRREVKLDFRDAGDRLYYMGISAAEPKAITPFGYVDLVAYFTVSSDNGLKVVGPVQMAGMSLLLDDAITVVPQNRFPQFAVLAPTDADVEVQVGTNDEFLFSAQSTQPSFSGLDQDGKYSPSEVHAIDVLGESVRVKFEGSPIGINANGAQTEKNYSGLVEDLGFDAQDVEHVEIIVPFAARFSFMHADFPTGYSDGDAKIANTKVWGGAGRLSIIGTQPVEQDEYQIAKAEVRRDRRVFREQSRDFEGFEREVMQYRMPFIAPRVGYQIYGEHQQFDLKSVSGGLTIGTLDFPIRGSADLHFEDISPIVDDPELPSAPLQFDVGSGGELLFQADSTVRVNGDPVVASKYTVGELVVILGGIMTVLAGILQFFEFRRNRSSAATST